MKAGACEETPLEMARRHVREGDARIRYQSSLIARMRGQRANTDLPEQLLEQYRIFQKLSRDHLAHEEDVEKQRPR